MEIKWVPTNPRLNIRCLKDSSKNGNYNVFVTKLGCQRSWSISCAVLWVWLRDTVLPNTSALCILNKKLNIWIPNSFNWATNKSRFTGIIKLCHSTRDGQNKWWHWVTELASMRLSCAKWVLISMNVHFKKVCAVIWIAVTTLVVKTLCYSRSRGSITVVPLLTMNKCTWMWLPTTVMQIAMHFISDVFKF